MKQNTVNAALSTIGMDLGDQRSHVCQLDLDGSVVEQASVPTTRSALRRKFANLPRCQVVIETGSHANWVHDLLVEVGHEVFVANARKVRAISENQSTVFPLRITSRRAAGLGPPLYER